MLKKLSFVDLIAAVIALLKKNTTAKIYDFVPQDAPSPLIYIEAAGKEPYDTKSTLWQNLTKAIPPFIN